jgi:benzoyl-CoA reductase subunit C
VRNCLESGLQGGYDFLDGMIAGNTCDNIHRLFDVWQNYLNTPFTHILSIPHIVTEESISFFKQELIQLKSHLEQIGEVTITEDSLREAIDLYNYSRQLLRQLYNLRKRVAPPISGAEVLEVINAGMRLPRHQFNMLLEDLLKELEHSSRSLSGGIRLLISGSILDSPEFIHAMEELGALVLTDDLCTGTRYFWDLVDTKHDPLAALASRYLTRAPCSRMRPYRGRLEHLINMVRDFQVDGVVYEVIKFCDLFGFDKAFFRERLSQIGIPFLELDIEYGGGAAIGQIRTRLQAFIEMLGG